MSIYSTRITVGTAAVELVSPSTMAQEVHLLCAGTAVVRLGGGPDVSSTTAWGLPVLPTIVNSPRNFFQTTIEPGDAVWGITASGESAVNVWVVRKA